MAWKLAEIQITNTSPLSHAILGQASTPASLYRIPAMQGLVKTSGSSPMPTERPLQIALEALAA